MKALKNHTVLDLLFLNYNLKNPCESKGQEIVD